MVVGSPDPDKPDAITPAEMDSASSDVTFLGWRNDVAEVMSAFDVFVLPSWREGLPRSAVEAAAAGKPLVLTDIRGCREVIGDGACGVLVPVRDPQALAAALLPLCSDSSLRARMGDAAFRRARERFTVERMVEGTAAVYERLLARRLPG